MRSGSPTGQCAMSNTVGTQGKQTEPDGPGVTGLGKSDYTSSTTQTQHHHLHSSHLSRRSLLPQHRRFSQQPRFAHQTLLRITHNSLICKESTKSAYRRVSVAYRRSTYRSPLRSPNLRSSRLHFGRRPRSTPSLLPHRISFLLDGTLSRDCYSCSVYTGIKSPSRPPSLFSSASTRSASPALCSLITTITDNGFKLS